MENGSQEDYKDYTNRHMVVLFHGLCSTPLELSVLETDLRKNGFIVQTPSIKGYAYGGTSGQWDDWLSEACTLVENLKRERPKTISVGGVSMGSVLALGVCERVDGVDNLVCLSPTLISDGWSIPWYRSLIWLGVMLGMGDRFKYPEQDPYGVKNDQMRAFIKRTLEKQEVSVAGGASFTLRHLHESKKLCRNVRKQLSNITANTLVIHAVEDEIASVLNADLIIETISSLRKRVIFLGNSYHMITIDNERETVNAEVVYFLSNPIETTLQTQNAHSTEIISPELRRYLKSKPGSKRSP